MRPSLSHRPRTAPLRSAAAAAAALCLGACAQPGKVDNAGYRLPEGPLSGVTAVVTVMPQQQIQAMAKTGGVRLQAGARVNAVAKRGVAGANGQPTCSIYLADTRDGLAALEHELWHCKIGDWHR
jgi:hypothetical protein